MINKWIIALLVISLSASGYAIYKIHSTSHDVLTAKTSYEQVKAAYDNLIEKAKQQEVGGQLADEITKEKLKSFSEFESSILNKIGTALTAVDVALTAGTIILALFAIIMLTITIVTTLRYGAIEEKLNAKLNDIEQITTKLDAKYSWVNAMPNILLGNFNQLLNEKSYANKAYEEAVIIDGDNVLANYFVGLHYAELYKPNNDKQFSDLLDKAKRAILKAVENIENNNSPKNVGGDVLKTDIYITLGSICGLFGERQQNDQLEIEARENFLKSLEYLKKAKELDSSLAKIYTNLGLTYYRLSDYDTAFENFKQALLKDHESIDPKYTKRNLPWKEKICNVNFEKKLKALADEHFKSIDSSEPVPYYSLFN